MSQIKRILVPTDFGPASDVALKYAIDVASRYGASIHLLHVIEDPTVTPVYPDAFYGELTAMRKAMRDEATRRLAELTNVSRSERIDVTTAIADGRPAPTIVDEANARDTDLIVMGTHGRSGVAHLVLGSVAEKVVRSAPCAVLTVREKSRVGDVLAAEAAAPQSVPVRV